MSTNTIHTAAAKILTQDTVDALHAVRSAIKELQDHEEALIGYHKRLTSQEDGAVQSVAWSLVGASSMGATHYTQTAISKMTGLFARAAFYRSMLVQQFARDGAAPHDVAPRMAIKSRRDDLSNEMMR